MIRVLINKFLPWFKGSFDTSEQGMSAKKATTFILVVLVVINNKYHVNDSNAFEFQLLYLSTVAALLGVATYDKYITRKNANDRPQDTSGESS